jgi:hypothetical protein
MVSFGGMSAGSMLQSDKGFLSHLKHLAASTGPWPPVMKAVDEERETRGSMAVSLSPPGKKRVSPLPPSNNPFKKQSIEESVLFLDPKKHTISSNNDEKKTAVPLRNSLMKAEGFGEEAPLASLSKREEETLVCINKVPSHGLDPERSEDQGSMRSCQVDLVLKNGCMREDGTRFSSSLNPCFSSSSSSLSSSAYPLVIESNLKQCSDAAVCIAKVPLEGGSRMKRKGKQRQQSKSSSARSNGRILAYFQRTGTSPTNLTNLTT